MNQRDQVLLEKAEALLAEIESVLPEFARTCSGTAKVVVIHQDAFAADYQDHEYAVLGKAIKFAGLHVLEVRVIGKNRETLTAKAVPVQ